jgi:ubiquitin carboxyl-terminal hydrolase 36/42
MADQNGAAAVSEAEAAPVQVETGAESGDAESEQYQPFFSMCQPIRSVSYSNSWDMVCAPTIKSNEHNVYSYLFFFAISLLSLCFWHS